MNIYPRSCTGKTGAKLRGYRSGLARLRRDRHAVTAIEFAFEAPALFIMLFGLMNLGYLGYVEYVLNRGVATSARYASIAATRAFVAERSGQATGFVCPAADAIQTIFAGAVSPPIAASVVPTLSVSWGGTLEDACPTGASGVSIPGAFVTVSATYEWSPLLLGFLFDHGFDLRAQATSPVIFGNG